MKISNITNNWGLKLLSVVIAFVLWLVVVNIDDPVISYTHTGVMVDVVNADSLTAKGKVYEILNNSNVISVTLIGKRSVIESIGKDDIKAIADIQDLTLMDTVAIKVTTTKNVNKLDAIKSDINALELSIENLKDIHLPVNVNIEGSPAGGYVVGDVVTNQNTIKVSGPESVIGQIEKAQCDISVEGRTTDISTSADIKLLDEYGDIVTHQNLSTNIKNINVTASVLATKAVDLVYSYSGVPSDGYVVTGDLECDKKAVYIAGKPSVIDNISVIAIPATAINVDGKNDTYTTSVNVGRYLPEGVRLADSSFDGNVAVTVNIEKTVEQIINVPVENLKFINLPAGKSAEINLGGADIKEEGGKHYLMFKGIGVSGAFDDIEGNDITGYVNVQAYMDELGVSELGDGNYSMGILFILPDGIQTYDDYQVGVTISDKK
ncbi:MAG: CdaR family protein [Lachnospiraceae bacterium]|nr:CdaR family protein [Lachnospiraceae bacterium]